MPVTNYHTVNGRLIGETTSGTKTSYLTDALGSITATVNSSGTVLNTYRFKPFGGLLAKTGASADPRFLHAGDTGSRTTFAKYAEQYNRNRHLGTTQGQWTTVDPLWPKELPYTYANANPISNTDSRGLSACTDRTEQYCKEARDAAYMNWGANCFCFVSNQMCMMIDFPPSLWTLLGKDHASKLRKCQSWVSCVSKCLYDCYATGKGCSPSAQACWERARHVGMTPEDSSNSPCTKLLCWDGTTPSPHRDCCNSMVFCEQTQYSYCTKTSKPPFVGGPCGHLDVDGSCCDVLSTVSELLGMPFDFCGGENTRQKDAFQNCCERKVWKRKVGPGLYYG